MKLTNLNMLLDNYEVALQHSLKALVALDAATENLNYNEAAAIEEAKEKGEIDGKNKDSRERQRELALSKDDSYQEALTEYRVAKVNYEEAKNDLAIAEAKISLYKAYLYSQSGLKNV